MNIEIANRLAELRKKAGLSQEELADKLGISRQAVSKWETASASPDTDNLICLAKLYGVSLDTLLNTDESIEDIANQKKEQQKESHKEQTIISSDGIYVKNDEEEVSISKDGIIVKDAEENINISSENKDAWIRKHKRDGIISSIVSGCTTLLVVTAYLLCGFLIKTPLGTTGVNAWAGLWPMFLLIPIVPSIADAIMKHKFCHVAVPVIVACVYCQCGMLLGAPAWSIGWIGFVIFPVYYIIFKPIDKAISEKRKEKGLDAPDGFFQEDEDEDEDKED